MSIRVALDTTPLFTTRAGVARYVAGLLHGIQTIPANDIEVKQLAWQVENLSYNNLFLRTAKTLYREMLWARTLAPRTLIMQNSDILHVTQRIPINHPSGIKCVTTLHDISVLLHPARFRRWTRFTSKYYMRKLLESDRIICVSKFTADEAIRQTGVSSRKLEIIYEGNTFSPAESLVQEISPPFNLPDEYFLFVGSIEPGKQLALLENAYELSEQEGRALPPLVIVGERWAGVASEKRSINNWIYTGRQSDGILAHLYKNAVALIFPSSYEGFGLPIVEAMSLGCPVICSAVASIPEVAGTAAIFAKQDAKSYLSAITSLSNNASLREEKQQAGLAQSSKFTWTKCAQETLNVYRSVMS